MPPAPHSGSFPGLDRGLFDSLKERCGLLSPVARMKPAQRVEADEITQRRSHQGGADTDIEAAAVRGWNIAAQRAAGVWHLTKGTLCTLCSFSLFGANMQKYVRAYMYCRRQILSPLHITVTVHSLIFMQSTFRMWPWISLHS